MASGRVLVVVVVLFSLLAQSFAGVINITPTGDWKTQLTARFAPGTIVNIAQGTYSHGSRLYLQLYGTRTQPIIIQGPSNQLATFVQTNPSGANAMEVDGSNFVLRNFKLNGGSLGLRLGVTTNVSNSIVQRVEIYNIRGTGLTLNTPGTPIRVHTNVTIRNNYIHDTNFGLPAGSTTGECMYLGTDPSCSGTCPQCTCNVQGVYVRNSLVKNNLCVNTLNSKVGWGSGYQIKGGCSGVKVVDNACYDTLGPCILTYASSYPSLPGSTGLIARNLVWNSRDIAIQSTSGWTITDNIIVGSTHNYGIGIIPNKGVPNNIKIQHNTVFNGNVASLYFSGFSAATTTSIIANNAIFAKSGATAFRFGDIASVVNARFRAVGNGVFGTIGYNFVSPSTVPFALSSPTTELVMTNNNWNPKSTSSLRNKGIRPYNTTLDFNCNPRNPTALTVGAYQFFSPAATSAWSNPQPRTFKAAPKCA